MSRYASQEAWIFAGSLRQNVLFGQPYDGERYSRVIKACALDHDIQKLEYGDLTLVGERGVSLSGGQKARVNLARAIYRYVFSEAMSPNSLFCQHFKLHLKNFYRILMITFPKVCSF